MASIRKEFSLDVPASRVWEAFRDLDDAEKRLAYSARSERLAHHNASFHLVEEGAARCTVVWIADVLPHAAAGPLGAMMDAGIAAMRKALASHSAPA